jgi:3-oxoacyl-[acyl-carrier-protein] synthase-3
MKQNIRAVIAANGSYIPERVVTDADFMDRQFKDNGVLIKKDNATIIKKFHEITGINERRYANSDILTSDMAHFAALDALQSSGIDPETLDYIIVGHNFGDVIDGSNRSDMLPNLATRVKAKLGIKNPDCVAYDIPFGCPGWVQGAIQASYYIHSGDAKRCLVIGAETLSRMIDPHDRDSMLYGDGAGAVIFEAAQDTEQGILAHKVQTHAIDHACLLRMALFPTDDDQEQKNLYVTMQGRKLYEFAIVQVPLVVKAALDKAGVHISEIKKVLIHQANEKMDSVILQRLFKLYDIDDYNEHEIMPMTISWLGNSSVATVPTLLDLIQKGKMDGYSINPGDKVVFASVGAGMHINAIVYQF